MDLYYYLGIRIGIPVLLIFAGVRIIAWRLKLNAEAEKALAEKKRLEKERAQDVLDA